MKRTYAVRAAISGACLVALVFSTSLPLFGVDPSYVIVWVLLPTFALAILLGKPIMQTVSSATGLTFFLTGRGVVIFYLVLMALTPLIAPAYLVWNLVKYFASADEAG